MSTKRSGSMSSFFFVTLMLLGFGIALGTDFVVIEQEKTRIESQTKMLSIVGNIRTFLGGEKNICADLTNFKNSDVVWTCQENNDKFSVNAQYSAKTFLSKMYNVANVDLTKKITSKMIRKIGSDDMWGIMLPTKLSWNEKCGKIGNKNDGPNEECEYNSMSIELYSIGEKVDIAINGDWWNTIALEENSTLYTGINNQGLSLSNGDSIKLYAPHAYLIDVFGLASLGIDENIFLDHNNIPVGYHGKNGKNIRVAIYDQRNYYKTNTVPIVQIVGLYIGNVESGRLKGTITKTLSVGSYKEDTTNTNFIFGPVPSI